MNEKKHLISILKVSQFAYKLNHIEHTVGWDFQVRGCGLTTQITLDCPLVVASVLTLTADVD